MTIVDSFADYLLKFVLTAGGILVAVTFIAELAANMRRH